MFPARPFSGASTAQLDQGTASTVLQELHDHSQNPFMPASTTLPLEVLNPAVPGNTHASAPPHMEHYTLLLHSMPLRLCTWHICDPIKPRPCLALSKAFKAWVVTR
jgi:hypothetical protein